MRVGKFGIRDISLLLIFVSIILLQGLEGPVAASDKRLYIEERKVDNITLGMDVSELIKKYPSRFRKTYVDRESEKSPAFIYSFNNGKSITFEVHETRDTNVIWFITVVDPYFKTRKGIGVGNTFKEVKKAYPNAKFIASEEEGESIVLNEKGFWFIFDISKVKRAWWLQKEKDINALKNIKINMINIVY